jgi:hypothetical protein
MQGRLNPENKNAGEVKWIQASKWSIARTQMEHPSGALHAHRWSRSISKVERCGDAFKCKVVWMPSTAVKRWKLQILSKMSEGVRVLTLGASKPDINVNKCCMAA